MAKKTKKAAIEPQSDKERAGFHKGCISTLTKEREEMQRILGIVESLLQMHIGELNSMGVDLEKEAGKEEKKKVKPIEDLL